MSSDVTKLRSLAACRVESAGLNWEQLEKRAQQIIVFGSYALASNLVCSDLDLLCIGKGRNFKSPKVHVIWIPEDRFSSPKWLGSELATHVAAYGKWIKGRNTWAHKTKPSLAAITDKRKNIIARLEAIERHWDDLLPRFRYNQITKLRRDLQRYRLMQKGSPPIPKTLLDYEWQKQSVVRSWKSLLPKGTGFSKRLLNFLHQRQIVELNE